MKSARVPFPVRLAYSAWMAVWVPVYWVENGWTNFLWICDFANFVLLAALWTGSALLATSQLVGVLFIQIVWAVDFFGRLLTGSHPVGGTEYMFEPGTPLGLRALSLFHLWTVPLLVWLVARTGRDPRGWRLQALITAVLLPAGQQLGSRAQNLNWMWAPFGVEQTLLPPLAFAAVSVPIVVVVLYLPADVLLRRWLARTRARAAP